MSLATSSEGSEAPDGVACQSEGIARLSLLRAVRQGVPRGRAGVRLRTAAVPTAEQPGVDGQTFEDIEAYGVERWLDELAEELQKQNVSTASRSGGCTSRSRTASSGRWGSRRSGTAWCRWRPLLVLEPIFEADLQPEQYAYRPRPQRPGRRAGRSTGC